MSPPPVPHLPAPSAAQVSPIPVQALIAYSSMLVECRSQKPQGTSDGVGHSSMAFVAYAADEVNLEEKMVRRKPSGSAAGKFLFKTKSHRSQGLVYHIYRHNMKNAVLNLCEITQNARLHAISLYGKGTVLTQISLEISAGQYTMEY